MNTCGTCKYFGEARSFEEWREDEDEERVTLRLHKCELLKHLNGGDNEQFAWTDPAGVIDGSGYHAALCVSEEFGCNQWKPKGSAG